LTGETGVPDPALTTKFKDVSISVFGDEETRLLDTPDLDDIGDNVTFRKISLWLSQMYVRVIIFTNSMTHSIIGRKEVVV
jgi:hypothetical protein